MEAALSTASGDGGGGGRARAGSLQGAQHQLLSLEALIHGLEHSWQGEVTLSYQVSRR